MSSQFYPNSSNGGRPRKQRAGQHVRASHAGMQIGNVGGLGANVAGPSGRRASARSSSRSSIHPRTGTARSAGIPRTAKPARKSASRPARNGKRPTARPSRTKRSGSATYAGTGVQPIGNVRANPARPKTRTSERRRAEAAQRSAARANRAQKQKPPRSNPSAPRPRADRTGAPKPRPRADEQAGPVVSRRQLIAGAVGIGVIAAVGAGAAAARSGSKPVIVTDALSVPKSSLSTLDDFEAADSYEDYLGLSGTYDLPLGTLLWSSSDEIAACLLPTDTGNPLAQIGILALSSGTVTTVLDAPVGQSAGFQIYDVRATTAGAVWVEADVLDGLWRVYTATLSSNKLGTPVLADEGDSTFQTPTLAVAGGFAFWQIVPQGTTAGIGGEQSVLKRCAFGSSSVDEVLRSNQRMATAPYSCDDGVVAAVRLETAGTYYQLRKINANTLETDDELTLPASVTPLEAGFGKTGFLFSLEKIYGSSSTQNGSSQAASSANAISNLGTYAPTSAPGSGGYGSTGWFNFARTPTAAPCWCGDYLMVKSTYAICGIDFSNQRYFAVDVDDGADTYGEYLASSGNRSVIVTYTSIDYSPVNSDKVQSCRVKVWKAKQQA